MREIHISLSLYVYIYIYIYIYIHTYTVIHHIKILSKSRSLLNIYGKLYDSCIEYMFKIKKAKDQLYYQLSTIKVHFGMTCLYILA